MWAAMCSKFQEAYQVMGQKDTSQPTLRSRNPPDRQFEYLSTPDEAEIPVDSTGEFESSHRARIPSPPKSNI